MVGRRQVWTLPAADAKARRENYSLGRGKHPRSDRFGIGDGDVTKNNKGRAPSKDATPKTTDSLHHTKTDPRIGWLNLAKSSRVARQQKRGWQRGRR